MLYVVEGSCVYSSPAPIIDLGTNYGWIIILHGYLNISRAKYLRKLVFAERGARRAMIPGGILIHLINIGF